MNLAKTLLTLFAIVGVSVFGVDLARGQDGQASDAKTNMSPHAFADRLSDLVVQLRVEKKLIGLGAMIMVDGKVVATAIDGERKKGSGIRLEAGDRWHLGSITKSMTATMIARLVERHEIEWATTVGEQFGESVEIHPDWRGVTLEQLLTHTSGAPANFPLATQFRRPPEGSQRVKARKAAVTAVLSKKPLSKPGTSFKYSNVGYAIAAAMLEEKTGKSWEDLIRKEIFLPLNLAHAGFGPPKGGECTPEPPRGHQKLGPFKRVAGEDEDNSPIMGPSGSVHMTLEELCVYGNEHLSGERGNGQLLQAETYKRLHTPRMKAYAFGWVVPEESAWTDERVIWHNGSNTMWYALVVLLPDRKAVVSITSNDGDIKRAEAAAFQIVEEFASTQ